MSRLGIIAGGGDLPVAIAECARKAGRDAFVLALNGSEPDFAGFPREEIGLGELGKSFALLHKNGCDTVTLAGRINRPDWKSIKMDVRGALALPKVVAAALKGDDALMRTMLAIFEKDGFKVIGTAEAAPELIATAGIYGRYKPDAQAMDDIAYALRIVRRMGELDIGQAAVVCEGLTLAVEAAEGTDAMMARLVNLPKTLRGTPQARRGVMLKAPKPTQDRRVDLPVIGARTVELASEAGLAGIAVEAGASLVIRKEKIVEMADRLGLFVMAFDKDIAEA
ncbi:MAG TPA: UDP-2,3-diacylglucosamine diphosphatase LpxI [Rhizomicrobium sp.]|jgi:hypothetical protein